jgi:hypothetical protein
LENFNKYYLIKDFPLPNANERNHHWKETIDSLQTQNNYETWRDNIVKEKEKRINLPYED